jgi:hypothetical protein
MQARIENPTMTFPGALEALTQLRASFSDAGIPETTHHLIEVRGTASRPSPGRSAATGWSMIKQPA